MQRRTFLKLLAGPLALPLSLSCAPTVAPSPSAAATGQQSPGKATGKDAGELRIAVQFGTAYLPAIIVTENQLVEKRVAGIRVSRTQLGQGGSVAEAILAGAVDAGFVGLGPFFVGWARGGDSRIAAALQDMPIGLNTSRPDVRTVHDIRAEDRIALPGVNSIQHVMLAMEARRQGLDPRAFDPQLVEMTHPDGEKALLARGDVRFHYTAPPYLDRERREPGISGVVESFETLGGPHTFNVAVVPARLQETRAEVYRAFVEALEEALDLINRDTSAAAAILRRSGGFTGTEAEAVAEIRDPEVNWTSEPHGLIKIATFMKEAGFVDRAPSDWKDVCWPNLHAKAGS